MSNMFTRMTVINLNEIDPWGDWILARNISPDKTTGGIDLANKFSQPLYEVIKVGKTYEEGTKRLKSGDVMDAGDSILAKIYEAIRPGLAKWMGVELSQLDLAYQKPEFVQVGDVLLLRCPKQYTVTYKGEPAFMFQATSNDIVAKVKIGARNIP